MSYLEHLVYLDRKGTRYFVRTANKNNNNNVYSPLAFNTIGHENTNKIKKK